MNHRIEVKFQIVEYYRILITDSRIYESNRFYSQKCGLSIEIVMDAWTKKNCQLTMHNKHHTHTHTNNSYTGALNKKKTHDHSGYILLMCMLTYMLTSNGFRNHQCCTQEFFIIYDNFNKWLKLYKISMQTGKFSFLLSHHHLKIICKKMSMTHLQ